MEGDRQWDAGERLRGDLGTAPMAALHLLKHLVGVRKSGKEPAREEEVGGFQARMHCEHCVF